MGSQEPEKEQCQEGTQINCAEPWGRLLRVTYKLRSGGGRGWGSEEGDPQGKVQGGMLLVQRGPWPGRCTRAPRTATLGQHVFNEGQ